MIFHLFQFWHRFWVFISILSCTCLINLCLFTTSSDQYKVLNSIAAACIFSDYKLVNWLHFWMLKIVFNLPILTQDHLVNTIDTCSRHHFLSGRGWGSFSQIHLVLEIYVPKMVENVCLRMVCFIGRIRSSIDSRQKTNINLNVMGEWAFCGCGFRGIMEDYWFDYCRQNKFRHVKFTLECFENSSWLWGQ